MIIKPKGRSRRRKGGTSQSRPEGAFQEQTQPCTEESTTKEHNKINDREETGRTVDSEKGNKEVLSEHNMQVHNNKKYNNRAQMRSQTHRNNKTGTITIIDRYKTYG